MPIVPLLKEWSQIEPDRCSHVGGMFAIRGWTLTQEFDITDRLVNAEIQCAVQDAIEAQGWHWVVGLITIEKGRYYKGRISLQKCKDQPDSAPLPTYLSTHSPTHVLLQAYIEALKVTRNLPGRVLDTENDAENGSIAPPKETEQKEQPNLEPAESVIESASSAAASEEAVTPHTSAEPGTAAFPQEATRESDTITAEDAPANATPNTATESSTEPVEEPDLAGERPAEKADLIPA